MKIPPSAEDWINNLILTPEGKQIFGNIRDELNISPSDIDKFYTKLNFIWKGAIISKSTPKQRSNLAISTLCDAVDKPPDLRFKGRPVPEGIASELSRFVNEDALEKLVPGVARMMSRSKDRKRQIYDYIVKCGLTETEEISIGGKRGIVWCSDLKSVDNERNRGKRTSEIIRKLGLEHFESSKAVIELQYKRENVPVNPDGNDLFAPTVLDAGEWYLFRPSKPNEPWGYALDLDTNGRGLPEMIHQFFKAEKKCVDINDRGILP